MKRKQKDNSPQLAHENPDFLKSYAGRDIRMLSEFRAPALILKKYQIQHTIVCFGSARTLSSAQWRKQVRDLKKANQWKGKAKKRLEALEKMCRYYDECREFTHRLGTWSKNRDEKYVISSGGGPGIMEAANRGAKDAGMPSVGLNISLPFEQHPNPYITPELNMQFHYFFVRKYWFLYTAKALCVFPGGFGTFDEMFEALTLIQTHKIMKKIPIILYGKDFWENMVNLQGFADSGMIDANDLKLFKIVDTVDEAFEYVTHGIEVNEPSFRKLIRQESTSEIDLFHDSP